MNSFYIDHTKFVIEDYSKNNYHIKSYDKVYNAYINEFTLNELIIQYYINGDYVIIDDYFKNNNIIVDNKYCIYIEAKESKKNINTVLEIIDYLYNNNFNKKNKLIVIGGGITQDIGGFVSAIFKRGIRWIYIPTTLLSMTDSCIGGKVGINRNSKNMLGLFCSPEKVIISIFFLKTLSEDMIISGLGESLKLAIICGENEITNFFRLYKNKDYLTIIKQSLVIKKSIIECDELEKNERRVLNYGHTIGHAIESSTDFFIPHGIAVLFGMLYINKLFCDDTFSTLNDYILNFIPKKYFIEFDNEKLIEHLKRDKKNQGSKICFIIPEKPGIFNIKFIELLDVKDKIINIKLD